MTKLNKPTPEEYESPFWMISLGSFVVAVAISLVLAVKLGGLWDILLAVWWGCGICALLLYPSRGNKETGWWGGLTALSFGFITLWVLLNGKPSNPSA